MNDADNLAPQEQPPADMRAGRRVQLFRRLVAALAAVFLFNGLFGAALSSRPKSAALAWTLVGAPLGLMVLWAAARRTRRRARWPLVLVAGAVGGLAGSLLDRGLSRSVSLPESLLEAPMIGALAAGALLLLAFAYRGAALDLGARRES